MSKEEPKNTSELSRLFQSLIVTFAYKKTDIQNLFSDAFSAAGSHKIHPDGYDETSISTRAILKIFLDTEFTDFVHPSLISLGMVAETGEEFYAEIPYPDTECSAFVREAVIPLLGKSPNDSCSKEALSGRLVEWLIAMNDQHGVLEICFDFQTDWDLFIDALDYRVPAWCGQKNVNRHINELLCYEYHKKNALPEHHALYDARANRFAYRERPDVTY